jgi:hypothetical protein
LPTIAVGALGVITNPASSGISAVLLVNLVLLMALGALLYVFADVGFYFSKSVVDFWIRGSSGSQRYQPLAVCLLAVLGIVFYTAIVYRVLHAAAEGADLTNATTITHFLAGQLAFVVSEELAYRGCFQPLLAYILRATTYNTAIAVVLVSVAFAGQHVGSNETAVMLTAFPVGMTLGFIFQRFGFLPAISVHLGSNLVMGLVLRWIVARL